MTSMTPQPTPPGIAAVERLMSSILDGKPRPGSGDAASDLRLLATALAEAVLRYERAEAAVAQASLDATRANERHSRCVTTFGRCGLCDGDGFGALVDGVLVPGPPCAACYGTGLPA